MAPKEQEKSVKPGVAVGDFCQAKSKDGVWLRGRILGKRLLPSSAGEQWEYFVHFDGKDWKFDEWLTADGLQAEAEGVRLNLDNDGAGASGSGTRRRSARLSTDDSENENEAKSRENLAELKSKVMCPAFGPPGKEIYRKDEVTIREVDGAEDEMYCQCLCLLGKAFIGHKDLVLSVAGFRFYVLCEVDRRGEHLVGYFSKDKKVTSESFNLSCIMVLPPYQGKGYGKLLIDLSYKLSSIMGQTGTPESPISDLGLLSYTSYWRWTLLSHLKDMCEQDVPLHLGRVAKLTGVLEADLVKTMMELGLMNENQAGVKTVKIPKKLIQETIDKFKVKRPKPTAIICDDCLAWRPPPKPEESNPKSL